MEHVLQGKPRFKNFHFSPFAPKPKLLQQQPFQAAPFVVVFEAAFGSRARACGAASVASHSLLGGRDDIGFLDVPIPFPPSHPGTGSWRLLLRRCTSQRPPVVFIPIQGDRWRLGCVVRLHLAHRHPVRVAIDIGQGFEVHNPAAGIRKTSDTTRRRGVAR